MKELGARIQELGGAVVRSGGLGVAAPSSGAMNLAGGSSAQSLGNVRPTEAPPRF
jgi:hypothetical protein